MEQLSSSPKKKQERAESSSMKEKHHVKISGSWTVTDGQKPFEQLPSPKKKKQKNSEPEDSSNEINDTSVDLPVPPKKVKKKKKHRENLDVSHENNSVEIIEDVINTFEEPAVNIKKKKHRKNLDVSLENNSEGRIDAIETSSERVEESVVKKKKKKRKGSLETTENDAFSEDAKAVQYVDESLEESAIKKKKKKHKDDGIHPAKYDSPRKGVREGFEAFGDLTDKPEESLDDSKVRKKRKKHDRDRTGQLGVDLTENTESLEVENLIEIPSQEDALVKTKKKKRKHEEGNNRHDLLGSEEPSPKKKKKREIRDRNFQEVPEEPCEESVEKEKKKKRKHKELDVTENFESPANKNRERREDGGDHDLLNVSSELLEESTLKKKKKKKKHSAGDLTLDIPGEQENQDPTEDPVEGRKKTKKHPVSNDESVASPVSQAAAEDRLGKETSEQLNLSSVTSPRTSSKAHKVLFCEVCDKQYVSRYFLKQHTQSHAKTFFCELCDKRFPTQKDLKVHVKTHAEVCRCDDLKDESEVCGRPKLKIQGAVQSDETQHACMLCSRRFAFRRGLVRHMLTHRDKNLEGEDCGQKCKLQLKLDNAEANEILYDCNLCGKRYTKKQNLNRHEVRKHGVRKFECGQCCMKFFFNYELKRHSLVHAEATFACNICNEKFATEQDVVVHVGIHRDVDVKDISEVYRKLQVKLEKSKARDSNPKSYACNLCDKQYANKAKLRYHAVTHGDRKFECGQCGMKFFYADGVKRHFLNVHAEKTFACKGCDQKFSTEKAVDMHAVIHGDKKFACDLCDEKFFRKVQLNFHIMTHFTDRPFKCRLCAHSYKSRRALKMHERTHLRGTAKIKLVRKEIRSKEDVMKREEEMWYIACPAENCGRRFLHPEAFDLHRRMEHLNDKKVMSSLKTEGDSSEDNEGKSKERGSDGGNGVSAGDKKKSIEVYQCTGCSTMYRGGDKLRCHVCILHKTNSTLFFPFNTQNKGSYAVPLKQISTLFNANTDKKVVI